ncbi:MAG: FHA domain-containing protein [Prevotellaceae bacterium]|jgi:ABC-type multidrug transport system fused ATPase/permease subunit|nr:FHA domain-containing protein [Prevotellaceae bacterium]
MEIIIGREGQQPFQITDQNVSRQHAKLTVSDNGRLQLEDLDSKRGTYIIPPGGKRQKVIKVDITLDTRVFLGQTYEVKVEQVLRSYLDGEEAKKKKKQEEEEAFRKFNDLQAVYEAYSKNKKAIQREAVMKNFYRSLPSSIGLAVAFALSMIFGSSVPWMPVAQKILGVFVIAFIGYTTMLVYNSQKEMPEKLEELNQRFKEDYVCPVCGNFLGDIPFSALKKRKKVCCLQNKLDT